MFFYDNYDQLQWFFPKPRINQMGKRFVICFDGEESTYFNFNEFKSCSDRCFGCKMLITTLTSRRTHYCDGFNHFVAFLWKVISTFVLYWPKSFSCDKRKYSDFCSIQIELRKRPF